MRRLLHLMKRNALPLTTMRALPAVIAFGFTVELTIVTPSDAAARPHCQQAGPHRDRDGTWHALSPSGATPSGRSAPAVAAQGRWVYAFGGSQDDVVTGEVTLHGDFFRLDTVRRRWQAVSVTGSRPGARAFAPMVSDPDADQLLMYGGATFGDFFSDFVALDDFWSFDPARWSWTQLPTMGGPGGRSGATLWLYDGKLHLFGGIDSYFQTHNDLWTYDLATEQWQVLIADGESASPPARHEALSGAELRDGVLTLYGGETVTEDFSFVTLDDTWQYDVALGTWQDVTPEAASNISPPRNLGAAALVGDALYVHGGDVPGGELCGAVFAQNPTEELWRFDLDSQEWRQLSPNGAPLARLKRSRGAMVRGEMYILGGYDFTCADGVGTQAWNTNVYRYRPAAHDHGH